MDDRGSGHGLDESLLVQRSLYLTIEPVIDTPATWSPKSHGCYEVLRKKTRALKNEGMDIHQRRKTPKFAGLIMVSCLLRTNKGRSVVASPRSSLSEKVENIYS